MAKPRALMTPEEKAQADARTRAWNLANPDRRRNIARLWARKWRIGREHVGREYAQRYRQAHPGKDAARYHADANFRMVVLLRCKLRDAVARLPNKTRCIERWGQRSTIGPLLGCSPVELKAHFESLFLPGMSWGNRGINGWEIDHIKPCASFDLTDPAQQALCFHYTNLRPLWRFDNQHARRI